MPTCRTHRDVTLICPACAGAAGGKASSPRKRTATALSLAKARAAKAAKKESSR